MKIGMMSAWNETSGVSIHAELVGEQWIKAGHKLCVFSFLEEDFHGRCLVGEDQEYVTRCFGTPMRTNYLNPIPFLREDYEFFIVQDLGMLPMDKLAKIFPAISKRAKTVLVVHTNKLKDDPSFYQFDWDAIVCFDHRYKKFLKKAHPEDKIHIIPFPYHEWIEGAKEGAREKLNLPLNRKIILNFGQRVEEFSKALPAISELSKDYPILVLIIGKDIKGIEKVREAKERGMEIEIREEQPNLEKVYEYLHASDALVLHRESTDGVVISSTVYQCLGAGCPIVALNSNLFEAFGNEILKYNDLKGLKGCIIDIFEEWERYKTSKLEAERVVKENSSEVIATKFIELFASL
jgi:glycosyltransferase involved in cell wall biosynthesis